VTSRLPVPRTLVLLCALAILAYALLCVALFVGQRRLLYFPPPVTPSQLSGTVELPVEGALLRVSVHEERGPGAVVWFGGNADDVASCLPILEAAFPDRAIYAMHYRGYGGSTGEPSEAAFRADALALYDRVVATHPDVIVAGRSLGSGVAVQLATQRPWTGLVLVTPYDSLQALAQRQFPMFPVSLMLRDKFESWRYAPSLQGPVVLVAAEHDEIVPRASTDLLLTRFRPGIATLHVLPGTGHNTILDPPAFARLMRATIPSAASTPQFAASAAVAPHGLRVDS
jgi:pimeloyl-ACP methyl ester carboxylesterase